MQTPFCFCKKVSKLSLSCKKHQPKNFLCFLLLNGFLRRKTIIKGQWTLPPQKEVFSCFLLISLSSISSLYYSTFEYHTFKTQSYNSSSLQLYFSKLLFGENPFKNFSFIIQQLIHLIKNYLLSKNCNLTTVPKLQQWGAQ